MDSATAAAVRSGAGFDALRAELPLRAAPRRRARGGAACRRARSASRGTWCSTSICAPFGGSALTGDLEVPKDTPLDADRRRGSPSPTSPRGTPSSCPSRWAGPRCSRRTRHLHRRERPGLQRLSGLPAGVHRGLRADGEPRHPGRRRGRRLLRIHTPLIALTKAEIMARACELGVDYGLTSTCYDPSPDGRPCGRCEACLLRRKGFREAGVGRSQRDAVKLS